MDYIDQLKQFSARVEQLSPNIATEEATKTALILPFFQMLGYDVFNPMEFVPEYTADVGIKKGEKVDYAIVIDGKPAILIEAKWCGENLDMHSSQLFQSSIIPQMSYLTVVLGLIGQADQYEQSSKLHDYSLKFTKEEMLDLFGEDAIKAYEQQQKEITPELLHFAKGDMDFLLSEITRDGSSETLEQLRNETLTFKNRQEFEDQRLHLLNTLEWVALLINTRVASEETIYQSLHQIFLKYIRLEYPTIAQFNSDYNASDQYYTNIILLYRRWEEKWQLANKKDVKLKQKAGNELLRRQKKHQKRRDGNVNYAPKV